MKLVVDLHTHTVASGHAYSTVAENAAAAAERGLEMIAITDHGPNLGGGAHSFHFWNMRVLPEYMSGVRLLRGCEANIVNRNGDLDIDEDILRALDVVQMGFHPNCGYDGDTEAQHTETLIKAMANPLVHVLVHPGNPWFPVDAKAIVDAAREYDVLLELNNSSFVTSRPGGEALTRAILKEAREHGVPVLLGSDAHLATAVGEFTAALKEAEDAGYTAEGIMNTSAERVLAFLKGKRSTIDQEK